MRKKAEAPKLNVRESLIVKGLIKPGKAETVNCDRCKLPFDRLPGRTWDKTCGPCIFRKKETTPCVRTTSH